MMKAKLLSDGYDGLRAENRKTMLWLALAFVAALALTIVAHLRPDWIQTALIAVTGSFGLLMLIGLQVIWGHRRGARR